MIEKTQVNIFTSPLFRLEISDNLKKLLDYLKKVSDYLQKYQHIFFFQILSSHYIILKKKIEILNL